MGKPPTLTEPGMYMYLNESLKTCRTKKNIFYTKFFNVGLFLIFASLLGGLLYYKYKGKMSPEEKEKRKKEQENYIVERIRKIKKDKERAQNILITNLPEITPLNKKFI